MNVLAPLKEDKEEILSHDAEDSLHESIDTTQMTGENHIRNGYRWQSDVFLTADIHLQHYLLTVQSSVGYILLQSDDTVLI